MLRSAGEITCHAVVLDLCYVPANGLPALNLSLILLRDASPHIVSAVPLKPSARVLFVYPALFLPNGERLGRIDLEEVHLRVIALRREFRFGEPVLRKLLFAVCHILAAEDSERQHLLGGELRGELGIEVFSFRFAEFVCVSVLHRIVDGDLLFSHTRKYNGFSASHS